MSTHLHARAGRTLRCLALVLLGGASGAGLLAQNLLLHYDLNATSGSYPNLGTLDAPLTSRGNHQTYGQAGSGVSGSAADRAWDASANTTQGVATPSNNAALTTPAAGLNFADLSGFTISFWFRTEQSLNGDSALRFLYKADRATATVAQGMTLRSLSGALELRIGSTEGEAVLVSYKFGTGSGYNRVGAWIFVALTWDGSSVRYFVGGPDYKLVEAGGGPFTASIVDFTGNLVLANTSSFNRGLDGWLDNFRFYDGALTPAELEVLRHTEAGVLPNGEVGGPLRPFADAYSVVGEAASPAESLGLPQLERLASGRLVTSYERTTNGSKAEFGHTVLATSDDGGATWTQRASFPLGSARLFATGSSLYLMGQAADLVISRSTDAGATWSAPAPLATGLTLHRSTGNVWQADGRVAVTLQSRVAQDHAGWAAADFAPILMVAEADADLTQLASWRWSNPVPFGAVFARFGGEGPDGRFFGVPFRVPPEIGDGPAYERLALTPVGWRDPQVLQIVDPAHHWYDPSGKTWHLFLRAQTGGAGFSGLLRVVEQPDGSLLASAQTAPSGVSHVLIPMAGAEGGFRVCMDPLTGTYWMLATQPLDSMRRPDRGGRPVEARGPLVLAFSINMIDWCFAAVVASPGATEATLQIDQDDLAIVSRQQRPGLPDAVTFRRLSDFRQLLY